MGRHVIAVVERFDARQKHAAHRFRMKPHDCKAPLRSIAQSEEIDFGVAERRTQVIQVLGALNDGIAGQIMIWIAG